MVSPDLDRVQSVRIRVAVAVRLGGKVRDFPFLLFHDDVWRSMPSADEDGLRRVPAVTTLIAAAFDAVEPDLLRFGFGLYSGVGVRCKVRVRVRDKVRARVT